MDREYYSIPEAAALLGISRIAVFKRVKKGRLAALRVGRNWAVPAAALKEVPSPMPRPPRFIPAAPSAAERKGEVPPAEPGSPDSEMDSMGWD